MEPVKEGMDQTEKTKIVELTLQEVNDLYKNPDKFKKLFLSQFPNEEESFRDNSQVAFRGARTRKPGQGSEVANNLQATGVEFVNPNLNRPVGIYIQSGQFADSYERSVHFACGENEDNGQTFEPKVGDVGIFSIYTIQKDGKYLVKPESLKYPGVGASNKKFIPAADGVSWNDLRRASLVFKIK